MIALSPLVVASCSAVLGLDDFETGDGSTSSATSTSDTSTGASMTSTTSTMGTGGDMATSTGTSSSSTLSAGGGGAGPTGTGGGTTIGSGGNGGSGGNPPTGPQLVMSKPAQDEGEASIEPFFLLYFDRPVSYASAVGKIRVHSDTHPADAIVQTFPCPEGEPTCIAGVYPMDFFLAGTNRLPGATKHVIIVDKSFPDPDGNTNDTDQVVAYSTFGYALNMLDDSAVLDGETGGLDYDRNTNALYTVGVHQSTGEAIVRRIPVLGDSLGAATTFAQPPTPGGPYCYGLTAKDGTIYVAGSYSNQAYIFPAVGAVQIIAGTTLPPPNDVLDQVRSIVPMGSGLYFGFGSYLGGGTLNDSVPKLGAGVWSIWKSGVVTSGANDGFVLAGDEGTTGAFLYMLVSDRILKMRASDGTIENTQTVARNTSVGEPELRIDQQGYLYVGTNDGLTVYDTSGDAGFKILKTRMGLPTGRFGLVQSGNQVDVYFVKYRDKAIIGRTKIIF